MAWAAGFLDGEGCFYLSKSGRASETRTPILKATQVRREPLERLKELFGGAVIERKTRTSTGKTAFDWQAKGSSIRGILEELLPYLIVKREVAKAVIGYTKTMRFVGGGSYRLTDIEREARRVAIAAYEEAKVYRP